MWTNKYKPESLKDFVGHNNIVNTFLTWIKNWTTDSKPLMFYGPPGIGKTALIQAYTKENNLDLIEVNASDVRTAKELKRTITSSVSQHSLFKRGKIFLIDEADGIAGKEDSGGVKELINIISETKHPVVMTCNNAYHIKLRELRKYCEMIQFRKVPVYDVAKKLKSICSNEKIKCDDEIINQIAKISNGDLRSAINDLETLSKASGRIKLEDLEDLGYRERENSIFDALKILFKTQSVLAAKLAINNVDKNIDEIFWWIENNIANEYEDPEEIAEAFNILSKADMFKRKISYRQNWKLMSYMIDFMTAGVSQAKKQTYSKFTRYEYPKNIMMLGRSKESRRTSNEVLQAFSKHLHTSKNKVKSYYLPYFKQMTGNKKFITELSSSMNVQREDIVNLLKS